ncbi:MAG TPA: hypothetical protein VNA25_14200 [Phycisphaerae bacterium]|nr:hypothetical protein [Phycisphaerae bacterium]
MKSRTTLQREIKIARKLHNVKKHVLNFGTASCTLLDKGNEGLLGYLDRFIAKHVRKQGEKEQFKPVPVALKDEEPQQYAERLDAWKARCMKRLQRKADDIEDIKSYLTRHEDFIMDPDPGPNAVTDYIRDIQGLQPAGVPAVAPGAESDRIAMLEQRIAQLEATPRRGPGRPKKE